ncbi:hypothetical protein BpHYR1_041664 [Brachionus plicatilis]|uniref:Uncharacterized protein n=1 Tax=Brachionus plicatilis TaxID=10195 RepID=A0A3M7STN9_BRAPC|nr:hypothetical protein BpHYR1_041664 [Brachionus plicatilis]
MNLTNTLNIKSSFDFFILISKNFIREKKHKNLNFLKEIDEKYFIDTMKFYSSPIAKKSDHYPKLTKKN